MGGTQKAEDIIIQKNIYLSDLGKDILNKTEFSQKKEKYELVRFTVEQLGLPSGATTDEIYERAEKLGLELCPAEVGPHLRLQYSGKEWIRIAMKQISDRDGAPGVFSLPSRGGQLTLGGDDARPAGRWNSDSKFVFLFRKLES